MNKENKNNQRDKDEMSKAQTGNASNPSAESDPTESQSQLLGERAEKYLREVASPEDYPDDQDWQQANDDMSGKERE